MKWSSGLQNFVTVRLLVVVGFGADSFLDAEARAERIAAAAFATAGIAVASGDGLSAILADDSVGLTHYLPHFSFAGCESGNRNIPAAIGTVVHVDDFGAVADDGKDDSRAILDAFAHAHELAGPRSSDSVRAGTAFSRNFLHNCGSRVKLAPF